MKCNAFEYEKLCNRLYNGVALTDEHLTEAAKQIREYILDGGGLDVVKSLQIGLRVLSKKEGDKETIEGIRLYFVGGENAGCELTIQEIKNIGMFFRDGTYDGRLNPDGTIKRSDFENGN